MSNPLLKIYTFFISLLLFGCHITENPCKIPDSVLKEIDKIDSLTKLPEVRERDRARNFNNYKEPSLIFAEHETYRFIWHSSFDGVKVCRVEKNKGNYRAITKTFKDQDSIPSVKEFSLSSKMWDHIAESLSIRGFWSYPSSIERNGLDGATWILEGYKPTGDECTGKNYHRLTRWSPADKKFIEMCDLLNGLKTD